MAALLAGCWLGSGLAVSVKRWAPATADAFAKGSMDGLSAGDRGMVLAPPLESWWGPEPGVVWAVAAGDDGAAFAAITDPASVIRVEQPGESSTWFAADAGELITALARAPRGAIFAGVSEPATLTEIAGPDRVEVRWRGEERYLWAIAPEQGGEVWVATGSPGRVLRVDRDGDARSLWTPDDDPVRCLAVHPFGGVVAGTGRNGLVARVEVDGTFILLDADEQEIVAVAVAQDGTVFAAAASVAAAIPSAERAAPNERRSDDSDGGPEPQPRVTVTVATGTVRSTATDASGAAGRKSDGSGGALYRIAPDGDVRVLWRSGSVVPYSLALDGRDALLGTGESGRILRVREDGSEEVVLRIPSGRVTSLDRARDGKLLVGGGSDARLSWIGTGVERSGTYVSEPIDAGWVSDWGELTWNGKEAGRESVKLSVRSGNTSDPDDTWMDWRSLERSDPGSSVPTGVSGSRWLQVRVLLEAGRADTSPAVWSLELSYRPRKRPPQSERLAVEDPGVAWNRGPSQSGTRYGALVVDDPVAAAARESLQPGNGLGPIRKAYEPGVRTFTWSVRDPDGDPVLASLEFQREGEDTWYPVARDVDDEFFSWDARWVSDGRYRVRLVVDDSPGNPASTQLVDRRVSDPFVLDRTAPRLVVEPETEAAASVVRIEAVDPGGAVASLEFSLDGGPWSGLKPLDGVNDGERERYVLDLARAPDAGARTLALRVADRFGNVGGALLTLGRDPADGRQGPAQ